MRKKTGLDQETKKVIVPTTERVMGGEEDQDMRKY